MIRIYKAYQRGIISRVLNSSFSNSNKRNDFFDKIDQSMYYKPRVTVSQFLSNHGIMFKESDKYIRIKECRFCVKPHYNDMSNLFTLNVHKISGFFHCFRCSASGSWMQFKKRYLDIDDDSISTIFKDQLYQKGTSPPQNQISDVEYMIYLHNLQSQDFAQIRQYLKSRGLNQQTIKKYKVGAGVAGFFNQDGQSQDIKVLYFPMYKIRKNKSKKNEQSSQESDKYHDVTISKIKLKGGSKDTKKYLRQYPSGQSAGLFGLNTIKESDKTVVITEGQFDAMSVNQNTGYPAISLPYGANSFPDSLVPLLNQFQKIILWMDNDEVGRLGCEKIAHKLGIQRTHIVKNEDKKLKDANDFLLNAPERMMKMLNTSKSKPDQSIMTFTDLKQSVKNRIFRYKQYTGLTIEWLPFFNKKVKGIRMQQLSVFSGQTGSGKTTFLSQLTLDLCKQNVPILWGSFQIRNQVLLTNMLIQFSQINLMKENDKFEYFSDSFQKLPFYYLNFHGSTKADKALDVIEYAIQKHNISVVVIDTLQFFLSGQAEGSSKFDLQDRVMSSLRNIATNYKVHIIVVIHPRKVEDNEDIQLHTIYGSSKATQEADNVWMIQNRDNFRIFDIKKNRFDGELGKTGIGFDKESKRFIQLSKNQLTLLYNKNGTMSDILEERAKKNEWTDKSFILEGQEENDENQLMKNPKFPKKRNPTS